MKVSGGADPGWVVVVVVAVVVVVLAVVVVEEVLLVEDKGEVMGVVVGAAMAPISPGSTVTAVAEGR